jgi:hypothetical protein
MARSLYDALQTSADEEGPWDEAPPHGFLRAMARHGRARRLAQELAAAELEEGLYVEELTEEDQRLRVAAQDSSVLRALYRQGPWRVLVVRQGSGATRITHQRGLPGATLMMEGPEWVPLEFGEAVDGPALAVLPETLVLLDARGRRVVLERQ